MLLCLLTAAASLGYYMISDRGVFTVVADFNTQQIPFLTAMNHYLKNASGTWCWNADLGTQLIGGYTFYNIGSPFVWLTFLFPKTLVPYLTGWLYILKYMVAGLTAYLYLRMFIKNKEYAVGGALVYAFSGFQSTNLLFFHFHDVVACFPLMLIGLEKMIAERKKGLFIFAVFLNCMVNYFFFISEVIFLILYYIVRFWKKDVVLFFKDAVLCMFCGIVGTGMAAFLFLPSVLFIMGNPRTQSSFHLRTLMYYGGHLLLAVKGFLLPGESMGNQSCIVPEHWYSADCYLPMIGGALAFAYMLKKRKDWLTKFLLILWIISCSPLLDSAFYLFTEPYKRWWFMFSLMLAAASVKVLDEREEYPVKAGILINLTLLILFGLSLLYLERSSWMETTVILRKQVFIINYVIAYLGLGLTWIFCLGRRQMRGNVWKAFLVCCCVFCVATTFYGLSLYRQNAETGRDYLKHYQAGLQLKKLDDQYRYNLTDNVLTLTGEASGVGSFNSTVSSSINEFDQLFDFERQNVSMIPDSVPGVRELLAAKYRLTREAPSVGEAADVFSVDETKYYVAEDPVCPIGFMLDTYITKSELKALPVSKRGMAMMDNLVVSDDDESVVADYLRHNSDVTDTEGSGEISAMVAAALENRVTDFHRLQSGFECTASLDSKRAVFFSVPYDSGWSAYVGGDKVEILDCGGLMGILLEPGEYRISFQYQVPGFKTGIGIAIVCFAVFAWSIWDTRKKGVYLPLAQFIAD